MTIYRWPAALGARAIAFNQRGMTAAGPPTLGGRTQVASLDAGYWMATVDFSTLTAGAAVKAFRALRAQLEGGAHQIRVPAFDGGRTDNGQLPYPAAGGAAANAFAEETYSDGTYHSDGHGFYKPSIRVTLAVAAELRATLVYATVGAAGTIVGGEYFSLRDRLHVVKKVVARSGSQLTLAVWPPLRAAEPIGRRLNFEKPVCRMRLMGESEMDLTLGRLWVAQPSAAFIEVF